MTDSTAVQESCYRIGVVSRLTGIEPVTLRAWERRYNVVDPVRTSGGGRLYSQTDVGRLALIKRLVDDGHAISAIAQLPDEQLHGLNDLTLPQSSGAPVRIVGCGIALPAWLQADTEHPKSYDLLAVFQQHEELLAKAPAMAPSLLVLEHPTVHEETARAVYDLLDHTGAQRAIIVCGFGRKQVLEQLDNDRITPLRAPLRMAELRRLIRPLSTAAPLPAAGADSGAGGPAPEQTIAARRYSDAELGRLSRLVSGIQCECPQHLADLLLSLNSFEKYSRECVQRNADDARLHRFLENTSGRARIMLEEALTYVIRHENIKL